LSEVEPAKHGPLAVIAGAGRLPSEIVAEMTERGDPVVVLPIAGLADGSFGAHQGEAISILDPAGAIAVLRRAGASGVVLAGTVHKPRLGLVLRGWQAVRHRDEIRSVVQGGDDNLLRGVVRFLEGNGFPVRGVGEVAPRLMAPAGQMGARPAPPQAMRDIARGFEALRALGPLDVGQAAVVCEGRILAIEAAEGTDAMLRRVAALRRSGPVGRLLRRGRPAVAERRGGVLVKAPKPGQDFRVDLPVIGPRTVALAAAAHLHGIAVEAGGVLVVERPRAAAEADRAGLFVVGETP
jgi:DUF1009 family protein